MQDPSDWRLQASGIPLKLVKSSGGIEAENASATQEVIIQATNLAAFASYCFPATYYNLGVVMYPRRRSFPGLRSLILKDLTWESWSGEKPVDPFGGDPFASADTYDEYLKVTLHYGTDPQNDEEPDPSNPRTYLEVSCDSSGNFLSQALSGKAATWDQDAVLGDKSNEVKNADIPHVVVENTQTWSVKWPQVPFEFFDQELIARFRARQGKVNNAALKLFNNVPVETILFSGYSLSNQHTWREGKSGQSPVDVNMKFIEKSFKHGTGDDEVQVTHNHFYDKEKGTWRRVYIDGKKPFTPIDLQAIWEPE